MNVAARVKRKIVKIDEEKCDGCGACVISCAEGALQIVDGKARLVSDKYCDSLGACLPGCPQGAICIEERLAEPFNEEAVKANVARQVQAASAGASCPSSSTLQLRKQPEPCACPSIASAKFQQAAPGKESASVPGASRLCHWPVQLALVSPGSAFLKGADVLLAADCTAYACGGFHEEFLKGHALLVACPKLDEYDERLRRLTEILCQSDIKSLTVLRMEVPCCAGLTHMARQAIEACGRDIPFAEKILGGKRRAKGLGPRWTTHWRETIVMTEDTKHVQSVNLAEAISYQPEGVVSKTLVDSKSGTVTLFAFWKGQGLSEHTAPFDAMVYLLDGEADVTVSGQPLHLKQGEMVIMPASQPHSLRAPGNFKMMLIMIKS